MTQIYKYFNFLIIWNLKFSKKLLIEICMMQIYYKNEKMIQKFS